VFRCDFVLHGDRIGVGDVGDANAELRRPILALDGDPTFGGSVEADDLPGPGQPCLDRSHVSTDGLPGVALGTVLGTAVLLGGTSLGNACHEE